MRAAVQSVDCRSSRRILPDSLTCGPLRIPSWVIGSGDLIVWVDGKQDLQDAEPSLTNTTLLAFTSHKGDLTDVHTMCGVTISANG
jgi:hypothetical protein